MSPSSSRDLTSLPPNRAKNGDFILYVNGKEDGGGVLPHSKNKWPASPLFLAGCEKRWGSERFIAGHIDDMAVWERPLAASEIETIYREGKSGRSLYQILAPGRPKVSLGVEREEAKVSDGTPAVLVFKRSSKDGR